MFLKGRLNDLVFDRGPYLARPPPAAGLGGRLLQIEKTQGTKGKKRGPV